MRSVSGRLLSFDWTGKPVRSLYKPTFCRGTMTGEALLL